jgi:hypothetical protein
MELPIARPPSSSPSFMTSPENNTPGAHSEINTPGNSHNASSLEFDEACFLALEAAMAKKKQPPAAAGGGAATGSATGSGSVAADGADAGAKAGANGTADTEPNGLDSVIGKDNNTTLPEISSAAPLAEVAAAKNDLVVDLSDEEEMELNFDDFDNL